MKLERRDGSTFLFGVKPGSSSWERWSVVEAELPPSPKAFYYEMPSHWEDHNTLQSEK